MKKKIPVQEPPVTSYMFYMYPLSIMRPHVAFTPWICSNYIQLYHYRGHGLYFYVSPLSPKGGKKNYYFSTCPFLDVQRLEQRIILRTYDDVVQFVISSIDEDCYAQLDVDYFYLPFTEPYKRYHYMHELLISGYDNTNKTFEISGYNRSWNYHIATITFDELYQSVNTVNSNASDGNLFTNNQLVESPMTFLYRIDSRKTYEIEIRQICEWLSDYLESVHTAEKFCMPFISQEEGLWGISVYSYLTETLDRGRNLETLTIPLRVLWEHKKITSERIWYLEEQGYIDSGNCLFKEYLEITKMANHARWLFLKCRKKPKASLVRSAKAILQDIAEREYRVLSNLRKLLEECNIAPVAASWPPDSLQEAKHASQFGDQAK